jgi:ubiquinone/menaquinone biosynthesis C-methylase UbiE
MQGYDKKRVARLFDDLISKKSTSSKHVKGSNTNLPQIAGQVAFERLQLKSDDVLLDVGTGTGDKAIAAAYICHQVIGIDISKKSLERARAKSAQEKLDNVIFTYGLFEEPCLKIDLTTYNITKILMVYSLHHLPDSLKKKSLKILVGLLHRPGRIVIGDIVLFDVPDKHRDKFDAVHYDAGDTDFPPRVEFLIECLEQLGAKVYVEEIHPLVGIIMADFQ